MDLMLVIEVDGISHWEEKVIEKDEKKQKDLEDVGFTVLRFDDDEVLNDIENVERVLLGFVEEYEKFHPLSSPRANALPRQRGHGPPPPYGHPRQRGRWNQEIK